MLLLMADGNFSGEYLVMDYDFGHEVHRRCARFDFRSTAQTTFTDANPQSSRWQLQRV